MTAAPIAAGTTRPEPTVPLAHVEEMLRLVVKAARAHQLYMHNNPMYARAIELARGSFAALWRDTDALVLQIGEAEISFEERTVYSEPDKAADSLPWLLFKDGLRELTMLRGFEDELLSFLEIIQRARRATPEEDDLLTLLWERDFSALRYRYVDLTSGDGPPLVGGDGREEPGSARAAVEASAAQFTGIVNIDDFDSTLYFLDEREVAYLKAEVAREYAGDLRLNVIAILFDIFEQNADAAVRDEVCGIVEGLILHLLSAREFRSVAAVLREASALARDSAAVDATHRERLRALPDQLSSVGAVSQLLEALDHAPTLPPQEDIAELFSQLRPAALAPALAWLGKLQDPKLRMLLETAVDRMAASNTTELVKLISDKDPRVALEASRRAAALRTPAAVAPLSRLLGEGTTELRLAAATALGDIGSPGALQALERAVDDEHRDVRVAAARAVAARGHRPALARIDAALKGKTMREADLTEKMAFFEAYGTLCGEPGVALLDGMLNGKSLLGRREDPETRACAAMALGRIGSGAALDALRRAGGDKEALVRSAVNRALREAAP